MLSTIGTAITANGNYPSNNGTPWPGGSGQLTITGTWNGATAKLQTSVDSGTTWVDVTDTTLTDNGYVGFTLAAGGPGTARKIRVNVASVGGSTSINAYVTTYDREAGYDSVGASGGDSATSVSVSAIIPGTGATNLGKAEDAAHTSGDVGVMLLGVRNDGLGTTFGGNGDYCPIGLGPQGQVWVISNRVEDSPHSTGDTGSFVLAVRNDNAAAALTDTDGDYSAFGVDSNGTLYIRTKPATQTNRSGTITTGATAQELMAANSSRRGWYLQNVSAENLFFYELGTATQAQPSTRLAPGQMYEPPFGGCVQSAISIIGATTGSAFVAREW